MSAAAQELYDAVPYPSRAFFDTHPDHLAGLAHLFGLRTPPPSTARVLELGCAAGGNLLPMAAAMPEARFYGIDASPVQIERARADASALSLANIRFDVGDIAAIPEDIGTWDYIASHGVWSWVPEDVQEGMFRTVRRHLAEDGVAYISYNVFPGWYGRLPARDLMLFHATSFPDPKARIGQARAILRFLAESIPAWEQHYLGFIRQLEAGLSASWDEYVFHEYLAPHNQPVYFTDFVRRAAGHDLQFLGEAELSSMVPRNLGPRVEETLEQLAQTVVAVEQYMDFVRYRSFRKTLIVHRERNPQRDLGPHRLPGLRIFGPVAARKRVRLDDDKAVEFGPVDEEGSVVADSRACKQAWVILAEMGRASISWEALLAECRARLGSLDDDEGARIGHSVLAAAGAGLIQVGVDEDHFVHHVSDRPLACPWARLQSSRETVATNRRHLSVPVAPLASTLLRLCDGTRTERDLAAALATPEASWEEEDRRRTKTAAQRRAVVRRGLRVLAAQALLVG